MAMRSSRNVVFCVCLRSNEEVIYIKRNIEPNDTIWKWYPRGQHIIWMKIVYFVPKMFNFYLNIFTSRLAVVPGVRYRMESANPFLAAGSWPSGWDAQHSGGWWCSLWDVGALGSLIELSIRSNHDDVIKWKHFPRYWPFVRGIHRSTVNSPHKGQWRGALMFSLICAWINGWVNNCEAGDLRPIVLIMTSL